MSRSLLVALALALATVTAAAGAGKASAARGRAKLSAQRASASKRASARRRSRAAQRKRLKRRRARRRRYPAMTLINPNRRRGNRLAVRVYDRRGRFRPAVVRQLTRFLRCRRTGRRHRIHPELIRRIYRVSRHFGDRPVYVYSGYRHRSVSWTPGSYHTKGRAVDFRVKGISKRRLRDYLIKRFKNAGVGYYTRSPFVHFDLRRRSAFWIDFSGAGERPRYASNARRLLALERRGIPIREAPRRRRRVPRSPASGELRLARAPRASAPAPRALAPLGPAPDGWTRRPAPSNRGDGE